LGKPSVENLKAEEGEALVYEAQFEVPPDIKLPEYLGLELTVEDRPVTEEQVEEQLEKLREAHAQLVAVEDRPVGEGDQVTVDLQGELLGLEAADREPETIEEKDVVVQVGDETTLDGFNQALPGMSVGDEKSVEIDYPEDYPQENLAGRRVRFLVRVTDLKRRELPELTDEFAKDIGEFESLPELRDRLRQQMVDQRQADRQNEIRKGATEKLVKMTAFEVPEALIEQRLEERLQSLARRMASQGIDPTRAKLDWRKVGQDMRPEVEDEVRGVLILDEVARAEGVEVKPEELDLEIEKIAESLNQPREKVRQYLLQEDQAADLKGEIRRRKALDIIMASADITE
jgi:trigger factor